MRLRYPNSSNRLNKNYLNTGNNKTPFGIYLSKLNIDQVPGDNNRYTGR